VFAGPIIGLENMKGVLSHRRGRFCVRVGGGIGRYGKREPESNGFDAMLPSTIDFDDEPRGGN